MLGEGGEGGRAHLQRLGGERGWCVNGGGSITPGV